jgi:hypothetical protein
VRTTLSGEIGGQQLQRAVGLATGNHVAEILARHAAICRQASEDHVAERADQAGAFGRRDELISPDAADARARSQRASASKPTEACA